ncbi:thiamine pyrophosphate-binding protein [Bradyrhizobium sp. AUGA SZCCT0042]|uniref:thiamine pyrophosphate-binding protein n=1 Tax=Bradyrhizobium sp. AUGA SZCCT0042 TaxID=2807651 RepID=UPI001BAC1AD6|nr:thiamine pyrophosphate-binding protein [Bradyrhizobium sp. AUGA SZCCT0042]MBR1301146.1 thiamine pyrophosphate-binding protein [Bradyrhizobium sp. AUGA SZCCT0042]
MLVSSAFRSGGQILVDALKIHGVDTVFCLPGESFLAAIDALANTSDEIRTIVARHEAGASHMAEAYGKLTGKPGICFVTRGPGASHASIGVHTASQDSTPMILFIGQVARGMLGREAWQEVDYRQMFGGMAKWVVEIDRPERIPELVSRAFHTAVSGRPGPVVVSLPEDMLAAQAKAADAGPHQRSAAYPGADQLSRLADLIGGAERPLLIVGGGGWNARACADLTLFVESFGLPVVSGFRRQDILDNRHPHYAGHAGLGPSPKLVERIRSADVIVAVGGRLGETTTSGYTLFEVPRPIQRFVHVHADPDELGRIYQADLMINAGMPEFAAAAAELRPRPSSKSDAEAARKAWVRAAREDLVADQMPGSMPGPVDLGAVMMHLREVLPNDTIISNGAGNYATWVHKFHRYGGYRTQLAPTSGSMGYGLPAAIAAKLVDPARTTVCFAGDGCFLMSANELATAAQYGLGVIVIVVNNGMYGSIRMHQEKEYPGRVHATALENPDFVALARAFGGHGELVSDTLSFADAFARARAFADEKRKPAVLELKIDPEAIAPGATLAQLRQRAIEAHRGS